MRRSARSCYAQLQAIMRSKLKFAAGASIADDRQARQPTRSNLFHALAHRRRGLLPQGARQGRARRRRRPPPENIRRMMRLGTLYRFQAIVEGMPNFKPIDPLTPDEMGGSRRAWRRNGLKFEDVRTGAFLNQAGNEPGKPCLMIEQALPGDRGSSGTRRAASSTPACSFSAATSDRCARPARRSAAQRI